MNRHNAPVAEIKYLRDVKKLPFYKIAKELNITFKQAHYYYNKPPERPGSRKRDVRVAVVHPDDLPLLTFGGIMHVTPVNPPRVTSSDHQKGLGVCDLCDWEPMCHIWVDRGDFIACERPLISELIDYEPSRTIPQVAETPSSAIETESPRITTEST